MSEAPAPQPPTGDPAQGNLTPPSETTENLWEEQIGFHKPLAGFTFNLVFALISQMISIFLAGVLVNIFYPWPESNGYRDVVNGIFTLFYTVMDLGTHMTMERFIADSRIKDPSKMKQYIQFFIWYQAFTGLVQVTMVTLYALYIVPNTSLAFGVWLMLVVATYQYPGYLGVFGGVLGSLQQYHRTAVLGFVTGQAFSRICEFSFVLFGRWYGANNPVVGEIMGIAMGAAIGSYISNFFAMWLSAWYFSKAMHKMGLRARDCFRIEFDRHLVKECVIFGIKTGAPNLVGIGIGLVVLWQFLLFVPQYTTFATLSGLMSGISGFVNWGSISAPTPAIAEAFLNGKKKLTQYYIAQTWRYIVVFQMLFLPMILTVFMVLPKFFVFFNMKNYILAIPFFFPTLLFNIQNPFTGFADSIQLGTGHPTQLMALRFTEECMKIFFITLFVVWLQLPIRYGITAIIWILPCGILPAVLWKTITAYALIHKRIVPLKVHAWQTFGAPIISGISVFVVLLLFLVFAFPPLEAAITFLPAIIISILLLVVVSLFGYLPLTGFLGGWDDDSLRDFERAVKMSGPSRWLVGPMFRITQKACRRSPLHNRFRIDATDANREARELFEMKAIHSQDLKDVAK